MPAAVGARAAIGVCVAALLALAAPASAGAVVRVVNTTADLASDGDCSTAPNGCTIRDALGVATSADSVTVPAGTYIVNPQLGPLILSGDKLNGAGARSTILDGGGAQGTRVISTSNDPLNGAGSQVSGVTIRRGNGVGSASSGTGGGVFISGALGLVNSEVVGNTAANNGGGIGIAGSATLTMVGSTVASNTATGGPGGGIWTGAESLVVVANSTISGNTAGDGNGGAIFSSGYTVALLNVTVAGNSGASIGGLAGVGAALQNTILYGNSGAQCGLSGTVTANNSLAQDGTCGLSGNGNITGVNPGLGALANNGGPTDTQAIGATSIAVDRGGAGCQATDQRGVPRPQLGSCDIGAYEYRAPVLTVVKRVVNDHGGTLAAGDFAVHVRVNGADVSASPRPGSVTGTGYTLAPGTYVVGEDADTRYTAVIVGSCAANGVVALAEGDVKSCTITNNDNPPRNGLINAKPEGGIVKVKLRSKGKFRRLTEGMQLPNRTIVDTRKGRVRLIAAANKNGGLADADFYDGLFRLTQSKGKKPIVTLTLIEKLSCKGAGKAASAAAKKKKKRRLWGDGKGRFRTEGSFSSATVRGTKWLVQDTCSTTLTRVKRGKVAVRDFVKHKTVLVRKNHRYIARAAR
jgi:hypothetical protein